MITLKQILTGTYLMISISAYTQDKGSTLTPIKEYASCCGAEAVENQFSTGQYLFVPNAFTPNKDGNNDFWYPMLSSGQDKIQAVFIYSIENDTLIHQIQEYSLYPAGTYGWDGTRTKNGQSAGDFKLHKGGFRYVIYFNEAVNVGNGAFTYKGTACSIACDKDSAYFRDKNGCFYPVQANAKGLFDKSIAARESSCFGK
jgi:hypothetical protein